MKETVEKKVPGPVTPGPEIPKPLVQKHISILIEGPNKLRLVHQGMGSSFEIESALRWALEAVQSEIRGS